MNNWQIYQTVDLTNAPAGAAVWRQALMRPGDNEAHTWTVRLLKNGEAPDMTGWGVSAYFIRNGATGTEAVVQSGSISGNLLSVTFPQACYAYEGKLVGVMRAGIGDTLVTVSEIVMSVGEALPDTLIDPGEVVPSLAQLLAQIGACEAATDAANTAAGAANTAAGAADTARGLLRYLHVRYAPSATPTDAQMSTTPNDFMGMSLSASSTAPTTASSYTWARINSAAIQAAVEASARTAASAADAAHAYMGMADSLASEAAASANRAAATASQIVTDEANRQSAERGRVSAEQERVGAEQSRASTEQSRVAAEQSRQTEEQGRVTAEQGRVSAENTRAQNETVRNTKLGNLTFGVTMIAPSGTPGAVTTQDADSIDVELSIPASNLAYATFEVDTEGDLYMISPEGFDDINFLIDNTTDELCVSIE